MPGGKHLHLQGEVDEDEKQMEEREFFPSVSVAGTGRKLGELR